MYQLQRLWFSSKIPIAEDHPCRSSPYSASKISADKLAESYYCSFNLPVVTARPFNTYGPRQTARAVIPTIASQIINGNKEIKLGSLSPTRDFNYVSDTANGMIEIALCSEAEGEVINIGSGEEWSIADTVKNISDICGVKVKVITEESRKRPKRSEVNRLICDNKKIKKLTNWESKISFLEGLEKTIEWIRKNKIYFDTKNYAK